MALSLTRRAESHEGEGQNLGDSCADIQVVRSAPNRVCKGHPHVFTCSCARDILTLLPASLLCMQRMPSCCLFSLSYMQGMPSRVLLFYLLTHPQNHPPHIRQECHRSVMFKLGIRSNSKSSTIEHPATKDLEGACKVEATYPSAIS
jgi:hypothetical protein